MPIARVNHLVQLRNCFGTMQLVLWQGGRMSRRDGTENLMVTQVESSFSALNDNREPRSKDWG